LRVVFLDRDGVINHCETGCFVTSVSELRLFPCAARSVRALNEAGFEVIVVSNQSGIARGLYGFAELEQITAEIKRRMKSEGARVLDFFYCPHADADECACRKPKPGLLQKAIEKYPRIDLDASFLVGDSLRDLQAGIAVGVRTILVLTGNGSRYVEAASRLVPPPLAVVSDFTEAVRLIVDFA